MYNRNMHKIIEDIKKMQDMMDERNIKLPAGYDEEIFRYEVYRGRVHGEIMMANKRFIKAIFNGKKGAYRRAIKKVEKWYRINSFKHDKGWKDRLWSEFCE